MIRIENLTKSYRTPKGRHYVFKDLNIELPTGKSVALVGRNGAGKSTLLRMIGGIDRPDKGRILTDQTISWPVGLQRLSAFHPCGYTGAYAWMCAFKYLQYRFRLTA